MLEHKILFEGVAVSMLKVCNGVNIVGYDIIFLQHGTMFFDTLEFKRRVKTDLFKISELKKNNNSYKGKTIKCFQFDSGLIIFNTREFGIFFNEEEFESIKKEFREILNSWDETDL